MKEKTKLIHAGFDRSNFAETSEPIFMTSGFVYDSAEQAEAVFTGDIERFQYTRYSNPTIDCFERRLAALEGAEECLSTASGMAAVYGALAGLCKAGDHIVAGRAMFGSCLQIVISILPKFGVTYELVDGYDNDQWAAALARKKTALCFIESPSNPTLQLTDIPAVVKMAKATDTKIVVDNVFATPMGQRPLALGADVVIYSATKHIDGQGRAMGGAILTSTALLDSGIRFFCRNTGPTLSPMNAWLLNKGLETLSSRMEEQCQNTLKVAEFLAEHKKVETTHYPMLPSHPQYELAQRMLKYAGTVVSFDIKGGKEEAFHMLNKTKLFRVSNNLGDSKSLSTHPATTTHFSVPDEEKLKIGITDGTIRLSVGLEDIDDIIEDLDMALS
ncbi:MAG: O-succinylhomoserine sulfhydrylase [Pseudomonadota bacterium]